jgi:hypothetical protein
MMDTKVFLDEDAIRKLTGCAQKARQVEQLRRMGVPFWINARGKPVVACSALEGSKKPEKPVKKWESTYLNS